MNYWKYSIRAEAPVAELLLAYLSEGPFESFEETEGGLDGYLPDTGSSRQAAEALLTALQERFRFEWKEHFVPAQNWNALWEANFPPVTVEDFCAVRASFHPPNATVEHELVIEPRMAFGTGHHETTWMCLRALRDLPCAGKRLLDFGCGTGILAILAARLGATAVVAVDIEEEAFKSTRENSRINGVSDRIRAYRGGLEVIVADTFDGIMANIERNTLLTSFPSLSALLRPKGWLLISGIVEKDAEVMEKAAESTGLHLSRRYERGRWLCLIFRKRSEER